MKPHPFFAAFMLLTGALTATRAEPPAGQNVIPPHLNALQLAGKNAADARVEQVAVTGQPFAGALRVETLKRPPYPWNITLVTLTSGPMHKGDVLLATVTARRIKSRQETGEALFEVIVEENEEEHHKLLELATSVGPEWTVIRAPFVADKDYPPGRAQFSMRFGYLPQTIEVAAVGLTNYGPALTLRDLPSTWARYEGWETNAPWRAAAAKRIEQIRKGDLNVDVVDANGKPVRAAKVSVRMLRHEFAFGSAIDSQRIISADQPNDESYRRTIEQYFNKVVFANDLKWHRWQTNRANWQQHRTNVLAAIDWLHARDIAVRGHVMIWPSWENVPGWLRQFESQPEQLRAAIDAHLADQTKVMRGKLAEWDVINESYAHNDVVKILGREEMARWFKLAHAGDPDVKLFYNDYIMFAGEGPGSPSQYFLDTVKFLNEQGAPIGGIGEQGHFGGSPPAPAKVLATFDRFAKLGLPIQISEFDIDTSDEELKLHYTRDFMTACFSHPAVNGVMMWGFWEGAHWRPRAALWNQDWSIRPHGQVWLDLVTKEWWTTTEGRTDRRGRFATRGFCGDYQVTVERGDQVVTRKLKLSKAGANAHIELN
jgi:endo-1,4-beta-xylanase